MSWNVNNLNKNIFLLKLYSFFRELDFTRSIFIVYLLGIGLSNFQVGILQTVLFVSIVLFEIPTGIWADKFKRTNILKIGALLMTFAFSIFYFSGNNFYLLMISFFLIGVSFAFNSGSDSSLLYDGLIEVEQEDKHIEIIGKIRTISTIALFLAVSSGGLLLDLYTPSIFILTAICSFFSFLILSNINESKFEKTPSVLLSYKDFLLTSKGKVLFKFILFLTIIEMSYTPIFVFIQSMLKEHNVSTMMVSVVVAMAFAIEAIAYQFTQKIKDIDLFKFINITILVMFVSLVAMGLLENIWIKTLFFFIYNTVPALLFAKTDDFFHEHINSDIRATFTSTKSLVSAVGISIGYIVLGYCFDKFGSSTSFLITAIMFPMTYIGLKISGIKSCL